MARRVNDHEAFLIALRRKAAARPDLCPAATALVVHLRLGDTLDWDRTDCPRSIARGTSCRFLHPAAAYRRLRLPRGVDHAVLVGDPFYRSKAVPHTGQRSLAYLGDVRQALRERVPVRSERIGAPVDDDIIFLSRARFLLPSSNSGFTRLVALAVRRANGTVLAL
mmetsp:Transcript_33492/g.110737  ORF Transcript_33492/g.110737 Transcript_33492/m.110737 type:complete len:166 (+) Transcript_33492:343-840(+)